MIRFGIHTLNKKKNLNKPQKFILGETTAPPIADLALRLQYTYSI